MCLCVCVLVALRKIQLFHEDANKTIDVGNRMKVRWKMASLVAHLVKNPPAMWETWVRSLG